MKHSDHNNRLSDSDNLAAVAGRDSERVYASGRSTAVAHLRHRFDTAEPKARVAFWTLMNQAGVHTPKQVINEWLQDRIAQLNQLIGDTVSNASHVRYVTDELEALAAQKVILQTLLYEANGTNPEHEAAAQAEPATGFQTP